MKLKILFGLIFLLVHDYALASVETELKPAAQYQGDRISLNFQDIEVRAVLQIFADFASFNLITSDTVKGNITLNLKNVPWDQALDVILKTKNLDKRQVDNVMLVGPRDEIMAREKQTLEAEKQAEELGPLKSSVIQINYAKAEDLVTILKEKSNSLMTSRGNVTVDKRTNTLLVQDVNLKLNEIYALVKKLDVPIRQVEISTQIVQANKVIEEALGVRFGIGTRFNAPSRETTALVENTINNSQGFFSDLGLVTLPSTGNKLATVGLALGKLQSGTLIDLELEALEAENKTTTIARPKLLTLNQSKASVEQGIEIPYQEATASGASSTSFRKAVLKLEVIPQITPNDKILMELHITNDTPGATISGANGATFVEINSNKLETKVLVDNGETVVLGGILYSNNTHNCAKVPFLSNIPVLGSLFKSKSKLDQRKELLIFITPRIVQ